MGYKEDLIEFYNEDKNISHLTNVEKVFACLEILSRASDLTRELQQRGLIKDWFDVEEIQEITEDGIYFDGSYRDSRYSEWIEKKLFVPMYAIFDNEIYVNELTEKKKQEEEEFYRKAKEKAEADKTATEKYERELLAKLKERYEHDS